MDDQGTVQLSWLDPAFTADPYALMREHPISKPVRDEGLMGWSVGAYAQVAELLRSPAYVKHPSRALDGPYTSIIGTSAGSLLFMDDPDHRRVRGLVSQAFTRRRVEAMRPRIEQIASNLLDAVDEPTFDVVSVLADPLPVIVISEMLGIDPSDRATFKRWSDDLVLGFDPFLSDETRARLAESRDALITYLIDAIDRRRREPGEDLISALIEAHDAGDRLTVEEMISLISLLLIAGNVTTTDLISNGVLALLQHPDQAGRLRDDPALLPNAVEEILRYDSPVLLTDRIPAEGAIIGGCTVGRGEWVWPILAAANHDPALNPEPARFDITRERIEHVSFGGGPHLCLGAPLARLEGQIAIGALLERFASLALAPGRRPERKNVPGFRGLADLWVVTEPFGAEGEQ